MEQNKKESGQVLILIILAAAVIFGFAALAVDVGRLYSERRRAQSAADAAAYAAAFAATQGEAYRIAGVASVTKNGFPDVDPLPNIDERMDVQIYNPPISGKYSVATSTIKPLEYYQVIIRNQVDPVFSQFVYNGPFFIQVEAVVRSTAKKSFADGNVIVATCPDCCDGVSFFGNPYIHVEGGDITSNSNGTGHSSCYSGENNGKGCIIVDNGGINLGGDWYPGSAKECRDNEGNIIAPPIQVDDGIHEDSEDIWTGTDPGTPGCTQENGSPLPIYVTSKYNNVGTVPGKPYVLSPGVYANGISISGKNSVVKLEPGMYCLDGDLDVPAGSLLGDGVMIVMRKNASIRITTGEPVSLTAPGTLPGKEDECIKDPKFFDTDENFCWSGFLFYMPYSNSGEVQIGGGNSTSYTGTIYAPGPRSPESQDKCTITGNSESMSINASVICYNVNVGGTGTIDIKYKDRLNAQQPALIELAK